MARRASDPYRALRASFAIGLCCALLATSMAAHAEHPRLFRIGTGELDGVYYPVGQLFAETFTEQPSIECHEVALCGIPGVVAVAQLASGSVANVRDLRSGDLDAALVQADVVHQAYLGQGVFSDAAPFDDLRLIARLYPEAVQLVVARAAGMRSVEDLRTKRVALDEPGSGTLGVARAILREYGVLDDVSPQFIKPSVALQRMRSGRVDAFFSVAGFPMQTVRSAAATGATTLLPITGPHAESLLEQLPYFSSGEIPAGVYENFEATKTLMVPALFVTTARLEEELGYAVTQRLWSDGAAMRFATHPVAAGLDAAGALSNVTLPLQRGARRWYVEAGLAP